MFRLGFLHSTISKPIINVGSKFGGRLTGITGRRNAGDYGGIHGYKPPSMNNMPVPVGDFASMYARQQRKYNAVLFGSLAFCGFTFLTAKQTGLIQFHSGPSFSGTIDPPIRKNSEIVVERSEPAIEKKLESPPPPPPEPKAVKAKPAVDPPKSAIPPKAIPPKAEAPKAEPKPVPPKEEIVASPKKEETPPPVPEKVYPSTTLSDGEQKVSVWDSGGIVGTIVEMILGSDQESDDKQEARKSHETQKNATVKDVLPGNLIEGSFEGLGGAREKLASSQAYATAAAAKPGGSNVCADRAVSGGVENSLLDAGKELNAESDGDSEEENQQLRTVLDKVVDLYEKVSEAIEETFDLDHICYGDMTPEDFAVSVLESDNAGEYEDVVVTEPDERGLVSQENPNLDICQSGRGQECVDAQRASVDEQLIESNRGSESQTLVSDAEAASDSVDRSNSLDLIEAKMKGNEEQVSAEVVDSDAKSVLVDNSEEGSGSSETLPEETPNKLIHFDIVMDLMEEASPFIMTVRVDPERLSSVDDAGKEKDTS